MADGLLELIKTDLRVIVGGRKLTVESAQYIKTMDTGCDALTCTFPWQYGDDPLLDIATAPYSYNDVIVQQGISPIPNLMVMYDVDHDTTSEGTTKTIYCYSKTADMLDSSVQLPYEQNNVTLLDRCLTQCSQLGIGVVVDPIAAAKASTPFLRVDAEPTDNMFEHLSKLAAQKGLLLSNLPTGDLYITKAKPIGIPVGTIIENVTSESNEYHMSFSGRNRWQQYTALSTSAQVLTPQSKLFALDSRVTRQRKLTFKTDDTIIGESLNAALWRRNKSAADSLSQDFPVNTWYAPNGTLWEPNTLVAIGSQTMGTIIPFTFLITRVQFDLQSDKTSAVLTLRPPGLYTDDPIIYEPWTVVT